VALELLNKEAEIYSNTPETAIFLVPGSPGDLSAAIRYNRDVYAAWGKLNTLVRTGKPVEKPEFHLGQDAERTRTFVLSMHHRALAIGRAVLEELDLTQCRTLLDVGGGPGTYSVLIARRHPATTSSGHRLHRSRPAGCGQGGGRADRAAGLRGTGQDACRRLSQHAFPCRQRCHQLLWHVPPGVAGQHPCASDSIRALLGKAYAALKPGGIVNVMDMMTDSSHTKPKFSALFAVNMALTTENGWVFADSELTGWLQEAGFTDVQVKPLPPPMPHSFATARK